MLVEDGLEVLDEGECRRLLATCHIGRVATSIGALPTVVPVNFTLLDSDVVFRTGVGTKLEAPVSEAVVAFEVDRFDDMDHGGWSVLVVGVARRIVDEEELARAAYLHLQPWAGGS